MSNKKKLGIQRRLGALMLIITIIIIVVACTGCTAETCDATAALFTAPLGLFMLLTKNIIIM